MAKKSREAVLREIYRRQVRPQWDRGYMPGIPATKSSCFSGSKGRVSNFSSPELGREVHCLSDCERAAALIGLFHSNVVGLQEQRWIPGHPIEHPLATFPGEIAAMLPNLPGLVEVARTLGIEHFLTYSTVRDESDPECPRTRRVVNPWFGDFLFALRDSQGVYCVNWSVKSTEQGFTHKQFGRSAGKSNADEDTVARTAGERAHYAAGRIPTYQVAADKIDKKLAENLHTACSSAATRILLSAAQKNELRQKYAAALVTGIPPLEVMMRFMRDHDVGATHLTRYFHQLIWERKLPVDLYRTIALEREVAVTDRDPLDKFQEWFRRGP